MHHRDQKFFGEGAGFLEGEATDEGGVASFLFGEDTGKSVRSESYIGIEEEESVIGGEVRELPASVLFTVPAGG